MNTKTLWCGLLVVTLAGMSGAFIWKAVTRNDPGAANLPVLGQVPDFSLMDQANRRWARQDLLGRTWVADFIYTRCPNLCPMMSRKMEVIQGLLPKESDIQLVSISVDPQHDKPPVLARYSRRFHAGSRWHFLTGAPEAVHRLSDGFKLTTPGEPPARRVTNHSNRLILVDAKARIRGYYDGTNDKEIQRLVKDLSAL